MIRDRSCNSRNGSIKTVVFIVAILACVAVLGFAVRNLLARGGDQDLFVYYTVKKTELPIVVTERGSLESQIQTTIRCEVENVSTDRSGNSGTQIISIVPNGSAVQEGDLLVEFDSATIRDRTDTQTVDYQKAVSAKLQAISKYENQLLQNKTTYAEAELAVKLAELELKMYMDEESGTFQLSREDIERQIDEAKNSTLEARAALELAKVDRSGMKELFRLGYRGKSDLDQSRLKFLQAEDRLASSVNQMKTHQGSRRKLTLYEYKMQQLTLQGAVDTAINALGQVENDNESLAAQAMAARDEAVNTELKEKERLERMERQLVNCKIYAPHGGMVVYFRERRGGTEVMEGATIRERQTVLTLPNLSKMQVKTQVHEAVLDQIRPGLAATVRVDAFPDRSYAAIIEKVAVVPSSDGGWGASSVKTYDTIVRLIEDVVSLKPGMTAVVNMHVDKLTDVLAIPVQAVVQMNRENWCYVESGNGVEKRILDIGRSNDKFVHIKEGLEDGDRVVLNPMDIFEEEEKQTENEIAPENGVPVISDEMQGKVDAAAAAQPPVGAGDEGRMRGGPRGEGGMRGGPAGEGRMRGAPGAEGATRGGPGGEGRMRGAPGGGGQRGEGAPRGEGRRQGGRRAGGGADGAAGGEGRTRGPRAEQASGGDS